MNSGSSYLIRRSSTRDLQVLEEIYAKARAFMAETGNPTQWGGERPSLGQLRQDIALGHGFVCMENGRIVGAFSYHTQGEPTYAHIEGIGWPDEEDYGVVHRLVTDGSRRGVAAYCLSWCRVHCRQIRIDTHEDNIPMRRLLDKLGYQFCGTIYVEDGMPRLAFYL